MAEFRWVSADGVNIPNEGLQAGTDADGEPIYAGRAYHEGDMIPAKIIPGRNVCYISYDGGEISKDDYEVLIPAKLRWVFAMDGQVPDGAVEAGYTASGETLYYGRVHSDGCITPGKVHPSHSAIYYPFAGEERKAREYEVLVV